MARSGRPRGKWPCLTYRRRQVLEHYEQRAAAGEQLNVARLARECGIYDRRTAARIVRDLTMLGLISRPSPAS